MKKIWAADYKSMNLSDYKLISSSEYKPAKPVATPAEIEEPELTETVVKQAVKKTAKKTAKKAVKKTAKNK